MAKVNVRWYVEWSKWWLGSIRIALASNKPSTVSALAEGGQRVFEAIFEPFAEFPSFKGPRFLIIANVYEWFKDHKDPLEKARNIMEELKKKYGDET